MKNIRSLLFKPAVWTTLVGAAMIIITLLVAVLLTRCFGDHCWPPRLGGILVGCSVLLQGYAWAHPEKFHKVLSTGHTTEQITVQAVYVVTIFGTFLWALGDFLSPFFGVLMCRAGA